MEGVCKDKTVAEAKSLLSDKYIQWRDREKIIRWLQIEPMLSKVDLRDYFWLSRDRIASIIPSNVMIPQRSREIFNSLLNAGAETAKVGIIKELVPTLDGLHLDGLYKLIKQKITIEPKVPDSYIILSLMVANGIENSVSALLEVLATIPKTAIPPQIIQRIRNLRESEFDAYLKEYEAEMQKSQNKG